MCPGETPAQSTAPRLLSVTVPRLTLPQQAGWQKRWETREEWQRLSKNIAKARAAVTKPAYPLPEAVSLLKQVKYAKFDETVDLTMRLGVDTRHADQMVRGTVVLPHGLGKTKTVAVIATRRPPEGSAPKPAPILWAAKRWWRRSRRKTGPPSTR